MLAGFPDILGVADLYLRRCCGPVLTENRKCCGNRKAQPLPVPTRRWRWHQRKRRLPRWHGVCVTVLSSLGSPLAPLLQESLNASKAGCCCAAGHVSNWCGAGCARIAMWGCPALISFELCCSLVDSSPIRSCPNISRRSSSSLRGCRVVGRDVHVMVLRYQHHCKREQEETRGVGLLAGDSVGHECTGAGRRINWCTRKGYRIYRVYIPALLPFCSW